MILFLRLVTMLRIKLRTLWIITITFYATGMAHGFLLLYLRLGYLFLFHSNLNFFLMYREPYGYMIIQEKSVTMMITSHLKKWIVITSEASWILNTPQTEDNVQHNDNVTRGWGQAVVNELCSYIRSIMSLTLGFHPCYCRCWKSTGLAV